MKATNQGKDRLKSLLKRRAKLSSSYARSNQRERTEQQKAEKEVKKEQQKQEVALRQDADTNPLVKQITAQLNKVRRGQASSTDLKVLRGQISQAIKRLQEGKLIELYLERRKCKKCKSSSRYGCTRTGKMTTSFL